MRRVNVFDDSAKIATITEAGNGSFYIFARSPREWGDMKRLLDSVEKLQEADPETKILESLISMLHNFDYSTELVDE